MADSSNIITEFAQGSAMGAARCAYFFTPADTIRSFGDSLFPEFAKNPVADVLSGRGHRFAAGHDLLVDVIGSNQSFADKIRHAGHIVLTDFPTKDGIPIPGFSQNGLGRFLIELGIPKGYLCLNICDAGIGLFAVAEGSADLMNAITGELTMNAWTFFDTFGEGSIELLSGVLTENPLLLLSGCENVSAGLIACAKFPTQSMESFFGYGLTGFMIGCILTALNSRGKERKEICKNFAAMTGRSLLVGGLSSISIGFSLGAVVGMFGFGLGKYLAQRNAATCTQEEFLAYIKWNKEDPLFRDIWDSTNMSDLVNDDDLKTLFSAENETENLLPDDSDLIDIDHDKN